MDERDFCIRHAYVQDDHTTVDDPYAIRDAEVDLCPDCRAILQSKRGAGRRYGIPALPSLVSSPITDETTDAEGVDGN